LIHDNPFSAKYGRYACNEVILKQAWFEIVQFEIKWLISSGLQFGDLKASYPYNYDKSPRNCNGLLLSIERI